MKNDLKRLLLSDLTLDLSQDLERHACVAIILKGDSVQNMQIGFIRRALNPDDKWAGQLAFPGGKREEYDATDLAAALREAKEEIGIDLHPSDLVGRINDIQARKAGTLLDFFIRPFVFYCENQPDHVPVLDPAEVAEFFWVPYAYLTEKSRQTSYRVGREHGFIELPAINLDRETPLWGLTYLMCLDLLERLNNS